MDNGRKLFSSGLRIREKKTFGDLRKCVADGLGFFSKGYGEVAFKLGDQIRDDRALESCKIGESEQFANILSTVSRLPKSD